MHAPLHGSPAQTREAHDRWRGSAASRGYDRAWGKLRLAHLRAEPLCRMCAAAGVVTAATVVDHIQPISVRPELRLVDENLRSLCKSHHDALTARQVAGGHRGAVGRPNRG